MGLVIAWRNPLPVQTLHRCTRMSENGSCARYIVEELIGGMQERVWIDSSTMEIRRGGNTRSPVPKSLRSMHHEEREPKEGHMRVRTNVKCHRYGHQLNR
jgi:hypothetical protein